jgi:hypothetical protein
MIHIPLDCNLITRTRKHGEEILRCKYVTFDGATDGLFCIIQKVHSVYLTTFGWISTAFWGQPFRNCDAGRLIFVRLNLAYRLWFPYLHLLYISHVNVPLINDSTMQRPYKSPETISLYDVWVTVTSSKQPILCSTVCKYSHVCR